MSKNAVFGMWGRYNTTPPILQDGDTGALQVNASGAVKVTTVVPTGNGSPRVGVRFGQPARFNQSTITLSDGQATALRIDKNGNLIIT